METARIIAAATALIAAAPAMAGETITYTYDAKGRVVKVEHAGTVNNNLKVEYTLDKVENRKNKKVTGSPNSPP